MKILILIILLVSAKVGAVLNKNGVHVYGIRQMKAGQVSAGIVRSANTQINVREIGGNNRGPEVKAYLKNVGLPEGNAWCMAFAQWNFDQSCRAIGVLRGDLAKGASVIDVYNRTWTKGRLLPASWIGKAGQLMLFQHGRTALGHVAIVEKDLGASMLQTIEGNTGPDGGRDGDGVYHKKRPVAGYSNLQTKAFFMFVE